MTREQEIEQQTFVYYETCSDEDIAKSKGFIQGAKWADETMIKKACRYLDANFPEIDSVGTWYKKSFIEEFKKAMEE